LDNLVVGKYLGSKELGYYMIAYSLINLFINTFKKIISRVLFPFYSRKINHDKKYIAKIEPLIKVQIISILVIVFTAFFLAEPMIKLIYGNKWISSIPIFTMLLMACTFRLISHILVPLFRAINELKPPAISKILEIILFFPITYFLTKQFDASGTALAMGLIFLISTSYRAYSISKILQFSFINIRTGTSIILFVSTLVLYFINLEYNIGNYMIYGTASLGLLLSLFILYKEKATIYALYYNK
jgi:PST family polysaccharide transporter